MRSSLVSLVTAAGLAAMVGGCSLVNAPDDVIPGGGGSSASSDAGPTSTSTGSTSTGSTSSDGGSGPSSSSAVGGGGAAPSCETPSDCDPTECEDASCDDGTCTLTPKGSGTACGPQGDGACVAAGRCDGDGACVTPSTEGAPCSTCEGDPVTCVCRAAVCEECGEFARVNTFAEADLVGWELSGGWGLYTRFPRDRQQAEEVPIGKRVLGTDGNRAHPYPGGADAAIGGELEKSSAITPTIELPAALTFRSWHEDEGGKDTGRDNKRIVARSGLLPEAVLVDCAVGPHQELAFCQPSDLTTQRAPGAWDTISIPLPSNLATLPGTIEFSYDTVDADGGRERGWFIDAVDVAGRCGCSDNADCAYLDGPCSLGICDAQTNACTVAPRSGSEGDACGAGEASTCSAADACNAFGYCDPKDRLDGSACTECQGGDCQACGDGECVACQAPIKTFEEPLPVLGWTLGVGWSVRITAPPSTNPQVSFGQHVFGTLGDESTTAETIETAIPDDLTFRSWHVDGGGTDGEGNKTITIITLAGDEVVILDCAGGVNDDAPPCLPVFGPRSGDAFDLVSLPTGAAAGEVATIVFGYETDGPPAFAQGWFIDDLDAVRCP